MGVQDVVTKKYMARNDIFAGLFNYYMYDGRKILCEEDFSEADSADALLLSDDKGRSHILEKYRDILKQCVLKFAGGIGYLLLGIENQTEVHYGMPVRNMLYDALTYTRQVSNIRWKHKKRGEFLSGAEFLCGLTREDRLVPIVTLVVYWGQDTWDAPCSLHEMLEPVDAEVLSYINDYRIHLVNPHQMQEEDFAKLGAELSVVMRFIKASVDKKAMQELLEKCREEYTKLERDAAEVIRVCAKVEITVDEEGKVANMCKAWDDHWEDGREQGMEQGDAKRIVVSVTALMKNLKLSLEEACKVLEIKMAEYERAKETVNP